MGRWEPGAKGGSRKRRSSCSSERGFEETTVADIAERAGLTKRTFFRYFADKREVLFSGSENLQDLHQRRPRRARRRLAARCGRRRPRRDAVVFERSRPRRPRQLIIAANPELQERELIKLAKLSAPSPPRCANAASLNRPRASPPTPGCGPPRRLRTLDRRPPRPGPAQAPPRRARRAEVRRRLSAGGRLRRRPRRAPAPPAPRAERRAAIAPRLASSASKTTRESTPATVPTIATPPRAVRSAGRRRGTRRRGCRSSPADLRRRAPAP